MLIYSGKFGTLRGAPWLAVELVSEARIEEIVLHLVRWARANVAEPWQILFPVASRDLDGVKLMSPYLWVRGEGVEEWTRARSVMGVVGLVTEANGKPLLTPDSFVRAVVMKARENAAGWSEGVEVGSFVRILLGSERMLCGTVTRIDRKYAHVTVSMRLRNLKWRGPIAALKVLKTTRRDYYFDGRD